MRPFVHLHSHSEYSLLDGASRISDMICWAKENNMPALALTDHGVLYGSIEFYKEAKKAGIKPILGCEVYIAPKSRFDKNGRDKDEENAYHLVLLAENEVGWKNLIRLVSLGHLEGFYYKPRIDKEILKEYKEGLIALSACLAGEIPSLYLRGDLVGAESAAKEYVEIFGKNHFYLEIQDQGIDVQKKLNFFLLNLGKRLEIPVVATNDAHYVTKANAQAQDVLMCIQMQKTVSDPSRLKFPSDNFYLKNGEEMSQIFADAPEAIENSLKIAERCQVELTFGKHLLPEFPVPQGETDVTYLRKLCEAALEDRYPQSSEEQLTRLNHELNIIQNMGFSSYFLIVWDFVRFAREKEIPVGPGRGSAAGSIVSYLLGITNLDPLEHRLLFERFLNPERITMPDIDIDFCYERRGEVLEYVIRKYGDDRVAQIITFGTLAARAAIRDAGRALGISYAEVDHVAKLIPRELGITIEKALDKSKELRELSETKPEVKHLLEIAKSIEGMPRNASTHAAGVVITPAELTTYVPLQNSPEGWVTTQWDKDRIEELGLLKMDLLGLTTLTIISHAVKNIEKTTGQKIDMEQIPKSDPKVATMLKLGRTAGVFQLESAGMTELAKQLGPTCFEEIIPFVALFRPGPLGSGMVEDFIERKHGRKKIEYLHPDLEEVLKETFGVILYQEQVMQIASRMAGFSLGESDLLRRAMSKKEAHVIAAERAHFIHGAESKGYDKELAGKIFDLISHFADYGFNKSHSATYAWIVYQTAWLKAHYPAEFMAAVLTNSLKSSDKMKHYMEVTKQMGIEILSPDIHQSGIEFQVNPQGQIRFGLSAIKNIGDAAIQSIIQERAKKEFTSFTDFCSRVDSRVVNKRVVESLIKSGCFDQLGVYRTQLLAVLEPVMDQAVQKQKNKDAGFMDLFALSEGEETFEEIVLPQIAEASSQEIQEWEKELMGFFISSHPLDEFREDLISCEPISKLLELEKESSWVSIGGMIQTNKRIVTQKGDMMSFANLEDHTSYIEVVAFPKIFDRYGKYLLEGAKVLVFGSLQIEEERAPKIIARHILPLNKSALRFVIEISSKLESEATLEEIQKCLKEYHGSLPVYLKIHSSRKIIKTFEDFWIAPSAQLMQKLAKIVPENSCYFIEERKSAFTE